MFCNIMNIKIHSGNEWANSAINKQQEAKEYLIESRKKINKYERQAGED